MGGKKNIDIAKNLRTIDWLKSEILVSLGNLYQSLARGEDALKEDAEELIANIILLSFLLGKRIGLDYKEIGSNLKEKVKLNILEEHKIEKWYGDLRELMEYLNSN